MGSGKKKEIISHPLECCYNTKNPPPPHFVGLTGPELTRDLPASVLGVSGLRAWATVNTLFAKFFRTLEKLDIVVHFVIPALGRNRRAEASRSSLGYDERDPVSNK